MPEDDVALIDSVSDIYEDATDEVDYIPDPNPYLAITYPDDSATGPVSSTTIGYIDLANSLSNAARQIAAANDSMSVSSQWSTAGVSNSIVDSSTVTYPYTMASTSTYAPNSYTWSDPNVSYGINLNQPTPMLTMMSPIDITQKPLPEKRATEFTFKMTFGGMSYEIKETINDELLFDEKMAYKATFIKSCLQKLIDAFWTRYDFGLEKDNIVTPKVDRFFDPDWYSTSEE